MDSEYSEANELKIEKFAVISSVEHEGTTIKLEMDTEREEGHIYYYYVSISVTKSYKSRSVAFRDLRLATKVYNLCKFGVNPRFE